MQKYTNKKSESVRGTIKKLGYKIVHVPHKLIEDYIACYKVKYKGKLVIPPAAEKLRIPLNEIWISEKYRDFEEYILYHELMEIKHRYEGYTAKQAHELAIKDTEKKYRDDPMYERLCKEINVASKETMIKLLGIDDETFQKIQENRPYHTIDEILEKVPTIGEKLFKKIKEHFWSLIS